MEAFGHSYNYVGKLFIPPWQVVAQSSMENPFYVLSSFYSTFAPSHTVLSWTRLPSGPIKSLPVATSVAPMTPKPQENESGLCEKLLTSFLSKQCPSTGQTSGVQAVWLMGFALYGRSNRKVTISLHYILASCFLFLEMPEHKLKGQQKKRTLSESFCYVRVLLTLWVCLCPVNIPDVKTWYFCDRAWQFRRWVICVYSLYTFWLCGPICWCKQGFLEHRRLYKSFTHWFIYSWLVLSS